MREEFGRRQPVEGDIGKAGADQQGFEALFRIEPLGIELIGDNAAFGMDDDLATDQPVAVAVEIALATDEVILVDPFPRARLEISAHPIAVHQVHDQCAAGAERTLDRFEDGKIVLWALEIAERIAQDADAMKLGVAKAKAARVAFVKGNLKIALPGALSAESDQVARAVEPSDAGKAAARELE